MKNYNWFFLSIFQQVHYFTNSLIWIGTTILQCGQWSSVVTDVLIFIKKIPPTPPCIHRWLGLYYLSIAGRFYSSRQGQPRVSMACNGSRRIEKIRQSETRRGHFSRVYNVKMKTKRRTPWKHGRGVNTMWRALTVVYCARAVSRIRRIDWRLKVSRLNDVRKTDDNRAISAFELFINSITPVTQRYSGSWNIPWSIGSCNGFV